MSEIEKPVLTLEQDRFLKNKSFDTYKKKLEVLSRAYSANAMKTINGFSLDSEEQYKALFEAVFSGVWDVDTWQDIFQRLQTLINQRFFYFCSKFVQNSFYWLKPWKKSRILLSSRIAFSLIKCP